MAKLMLQFRQQGKAPTLEEVRTMYGLHADEIDSDFGIVQTDSREGLYSVLVEEAARPRIEEKHKLMGVDTDPAIGLFSNPRIEPFGPPV